MITITRQIIKGKNLANKLGFPTANLKYYKKDNLEFGVYIIKALFNKKIFHGLAHVGPSPTLKIKQPRIEIHLFNFNQDIYQQKITIQFFEKIRPIKKFPTQQKLINQIKQDIQHAKKLSAQISVRNQR